MAWRAAVALAAALLCTSGASAEPLWGLGGRKLDPTSTNITIPNAYLNRVFDAYYAACPGGESTTCCSNATLRKYICNLAGDSCPLSFSDGEASSLLECTRDATLAGVDAVVCMPGLYLNASKSVVACPAGFFCPVTVDCRVGCLPGAYCPPAPPMVPVDNRSHAPDGVGGVGVGNDPPCDPGSNSSAVCTCGRGGAPPTVVHEYDGSIAKPTGIAYLCPGNAKGSACPSGSYCSNATALAECPAGSYCPEGTQVPIKCNVFTACPAGSSKDVANLQGLVWIALASIVIVALLWVVEWLRRRHDELEESPETKAMVESRRLSHTRQRSFDDMASISVTSSAADSPSTTPRLSRRLPRKRPGGGATPPRQQPVKPTAHLRTLSEPAPELAEGLSLSSGVSESNVSLELGAPGDVELIDPSSQAVEVELRNVSLTLKKDPTKEILHNISGRMYPESVTVIMGPSGAGKTSLLNVLLGKANDYADVGGQVLLNNVEQSTDSFRREVGFVPQDDIMHTELTVRETLMFQASLRLPPSWSPRRITQLVNSTLAMLELEHVKNSVIGDTRKRGVSGGQRKRVNIGMELVCNPRLLVLDEPTSGLDSTSGLRILHALQSAALIKGLTIILVLHQPRFEIFRCCDRLFLLDGAGTLTYEGHTRYATRYFEKLGYKLPHLMNPADWILDIVSGVAKAPPGSPPSTRPLDALWLEHTGTRTRVHTEAIFSINSINTGSGGNAALAIVQRAERSFAVQLWFFFARECVLLLRQRNVVLFDVFLVFVGALFLAGSKMNNVSIQAYSELATLSSIILGVTTLTFSCRVFSQYQTVYWREAARGVNRTAYFLAANLAQIPVFCFATTIYFTVLYTLLTPRSGFAEAYGLTLAFAFTTCGLGYLSANLFDPKTSVMAGIVVVLISAMLGGSNPTPKDCASTIIGPKLIEISMARFYIWGWWQDEANAQPLINWVDVSGLQSHYEVPLSPPFLPVACGVLVLYGVLCRVAAFVFMVRRNRAKQR